jgi:apolipoprotein N-acyltransferase
MAMRRIYLLALAGSIATAVSPLLPWLRLGNVGLQGIPDPAGFFVLATGLLGIVFTAIGLRSARDMRQWAMLAGLAGLTALIVVWQTGPATISDRAHARAEAIAIVDNVAPEPVPPVRTGIGLWLGIVGAIVTLGAGMTGVRPTDADVESGVTTSRAPHVR